MGPVPVGPRRLDTPFWERSGGRVRVLTTEIPSPDIVRDGGDDFYHDLVSDKRDADMWNFLKRYHHTPALTGPEEEIATLLEERGFTVSRGQIRFPTRTSGWVWSEPIKRLEQIRKQVPDADLALVVSTRWWGVTRKYGGIFPTGPHRARVDFTGELYDLSNNLLLWYCEASGTSDIDRQWNEPPDQPKLRSALEAAQAEGEANLMASLRAWDGTFAFTALRPPGRRSSMRDRSNR